MKFDLVFQGGGAKGMAYVGAMKAFENNGLEMRRLVGTSAGAINAALLAAGYTYKEMAAVLDEKDKEGNPIFEGFMSAPLPNEFSDKVFDKSLIVSVFKALQEYFWNSSAKNNVEIQGNEKNNLNWVQTTIETITAMNSATSLTIRLILEFTPEAYQGYITMAFNFIEQGGVFSARKFVKWMEDRLAAKNLAIDITFEQLFEKSGRDLTLVASDLTANNMLVLNHTTAPNLPISWAVRMSMNIPFVWDPVIWRKEFGTYLGNNLVGHRIVDGGALSNFAIRLTTSNSPAVKAVMDQNFSPDEAPTIGFILDSNLPVPGAPAPEKEDPIELPSWLNWLGWLLSSINHVRTEATNSTNFMNTAGELILTMMVATDNLAIDANSEQICRLPVKDFGTLEFGMSDKRRTALVSEAQRVTQKFLDNIPTFQLNELNLEVGKTGIFEITYKLNGTPGRFDWVGLFPSSSAPQGDFTGGNWKYINQIKDNRFVTETKAELGSFVARYYRHISGRQYELVAETGSFLQARAI